MCKINTWCAIRIASLIIMYIIILCDTHLFYAVYAMTHSLYVRTTKNEE